PARNKLYLSQRKHLAPIRVPAKRMDREHQVLGFDARERSAAGQSRGYIGLPDYRRFQRSKGRKSPKPSLEPAAIRHCSRRRLFFPPKFARVALLRRA